MNDISGVMEQLRSRFSPLGYEVQADGTELVGRATHVAPKAWLHVIFRPLTDEEIAYLQSRLPLRMPDEYRKFLRTHNGLSVYSGELSLDGLRVSYDRSGERREPFDLTTPNVEERPADAAADAFFFGGYKDDGSLVALRGDGVVERTPPHQAAHRTRSWPSFEEFLTSELTRLGEEFGEDGRRLGQRD